MTETAAWEKAVSLNGFSPAVLEDFPDLHRTMLHDYLVHLANERFGEGRWVERADASLEEYEPVTREREYEDDDPDSETFGETIRYHDDSRYFWMSAWFRPKLEGE